MDPSDPVTRLLADTDEGSELPRSALLFAALVEPSNDEALDLDEAVALDRVRQGLLGLAEPPSHVGRYRIVGRVGHGGMGVVLAAHDDALDRPVAIKVLRRELAADTVWRDRFNREAQALARLSHPNVVQVYEVGAHGGEVFIAMEMVEGTPLRAWSRAEPRGWREIVDVLLGAGAGLWAAHRAGLIHRDFKPENVLVDLEGRARVLDFGVVRFEAGAILPPRSPSGPFATMPAASMDSMTAAGTIMGTPVYMAPEQRAGAVIDARADQYAFGVSLYETLYGARPRATTVTSAGAESANAAADGTGVPASTHGRGRVPRWVHAVVVRALAADPAQRWASMGEMLRALQQPPRTRTIIGLGAATAAVAITFGARAWISSRAQAECERGAATMREWWDGASTSAEAGLLATGVPNAAQTWAAAHPRVARFVDEWSDARVHACTAVEVDGSADADWLDAVSACLDERGAALEALADIWSSATPEDVAGVAPAAASLPLLTGCSDPSVRARGTDGEQLARGQLFRADAARIAGRYRDATALAQAIEDHGVAPDLRAAAAILLARIAIDDGDFDGAEPHLRAGFVRGIEAGRNDIAGEAASRLAMLVGTKGRRYEEYDQWAEIARAAFTQAQLPESDPRMLGLRNGEAGVMSSRGDPRAALLVRREALAGLVAVYGEDHPETLSCRRALAIDFSLTGDHAQALAEHRAILKLREDLLGRDHPGIADTLHNLGNVLTVLGDPKGAIAAHEREYELVTTYYGQRHPLVPQALESLGGDHMMMHDPATALAFFDRALAAQVQLDRGESFHQARQMNRRGWALTELGRPDQAERAAAQGLAMLERTLGPEHVDVSYSLAELAAIRSTRGDEAGARPLLERAIEIRAAKMGADNPELVGLRAQLAASSLALREPTAAEPGPLARAITPK
jgi:eukaryotic-like serine/threonine-protein kinase